MRNLVCFDVDGVLADFEGRLVDVLADEFGVIARQKREFFRLEDRFADQPEILHRATELVNNPNFYYGLKPVRGAFYFVDMMMNEGKGIVFLSSRPLSAENFTRRWLRTKVYKGDVHLYCGIDDKAGFLEPVADSVDFVVEDNPKHIEELKDAGVDVICFDQPWNQGIFPRMYIRADGEPMLWAQDYMESEAFLVKE